MPAKRAGAAGSYRVVDSHRSRGVDLKGRVGTVDDAWEKCEEDPHCCCAELADEAAAVTVTMDAADGDDRGTFTYYFAEHELAQLPARVAAAATAAVAAAASAAQDVEPMLVAFRRGNPRTITRGRGVARTGEFCVVAASPRPATPQAAAPRRDVALALVLPLLAYKVAAVVNGNKLMPTLDATIALASIAALYYCFT